MTEDTIKIGVIGGSGIYEVEGISNIEERKVDTPFGEPSDNVIVGEISGIKVAFLPRHGRGHRYMPTGVNYRANIFALKKLGVEKIVSLSAVGSMKKELKPGDVVLVDQYYDHTKHRASTFYGTGMVVHIGFSEPVCASLADTVAQAAASEGATVHRGGTYICMEGPQFSTRGESDIYRSWGVSVIGMTAMPEAKLAREAEICYATMALVTDYDCWNTEHDAVTVDMVVKQLFENADIAKKTIVGVVEKYAQYGIETCACNEALKNAVMTAPDKIDPKMREELDILIGKYIK
ncbi:MAG: S-methyl-5'-thioadenosine phosphorylase [Elusimicrobiota bacterium]